VIIALKKLATREDTLKSMVGMNLSERCILLHRMMPDICIKRSTLSNIYKEYSVKKKVIRKVKIVPEKSQEYVDRAIIDCRERIKNYMKQNVPVVFCDESCLTSKLLPSREWMNKSANIEIDEKKLNAKTLAFVVALSKDKGLVAVNSFPRALDKDDFIVFLKNIKKIYGDQKIGLYLDGASFHRAHKVKDYA
jgi:hypothetical protein